MIGRVHIALQRLQSGEQHVVAPSQVVRPLDAEIVSAASVSRLITPEMPVDLVRGIISMPPVQQADDWHSWENVRQAHRDAATLAIEQTPTYEPAPIDRGIVVVGGGKYFVSAYITIQVLRHVGCQLPIELWHLDGEITPEMEAILRPLGVSFRNADGPDERPFRFLNHWWRGWQLKSYALRHCSFREVLLLDADSYPVRNPEFLFDWRQYRERGAIFWPDLAKHSDMVPKQAFEIFGCEPFPGLPTESGQILLNRELCWRELNLALHYNAQADFTYRIIYGDKDTFPMAWSRLGRRHARMFPLVRFDSVALLQADDQGQALFVHRVHDKFRLPLVKFDGTNQHEPENRFHPQFPLESFCFAALTEVRKLMGR